MEPNEKITPPKAESRPYSLVSKHGHQRNDNYYWLNDRENPEVIAYLNAENDYFDQIMAPTKTLQEELYMEMKNRIKEDDSTVPYKDDDFYYYARFEEGKEYPVYCRKKYSLDNEEEIVVDGNQLAENHTYLNFHVSISTDHQLAAIIMDTQGRNFFTIKVKELTRGELLPDTIEDTRGGVEWANDNKSFFYALPEKTTLRNHQVKRHFLGEDSAKDQLVYEEKDETLNCFIGKSKSKKYIFLESSRTDASCTLFIDADNPQAPQLLTRFSSKVHYHVDHVKGDVFYLYTNKEATNYKIVSCPIGTFESEAWVDVVPHRNQVFLETATYFKDFMAMEEKENGLSKIRIVRWSDGSEYTIAFDEPTYAAGLHLNPEYDTPWVRYSYTSMTTPGSIYDYNMETGERILRKQQPVVGDFDSTRYKTERIWVDGVDGISIPMSLVYRKDVFRKDGSNPGWIYSYGSYGHSTDATFSSARISLLDRGFVFAIAHIRGGQELGGDWYEQGKMMHKKNTFFDFIQCSKWLLDNRYVDQASLFASGGSAGGLLIGAVINMAPEIYKGVIAAVPFVDVVTTMMDESIPLTTFEWQEWGNPNMQDEYDYMLSYSPYDNVEKKNYPNILVTTGLHDSQVQYWEPAKWVALLRAQKQDNNLLLMHTNMEVGHGGASGRFERLKEVARDYAFSLYVLGMKK